MGDEMNRSHTVEEQREIARITLLFVNMGKGENSHPPIFFEESEEKERRKGIREERAVNSKRKSTFTKGSRGLYTLW